MTRVYAKVKGNGVNRKPVHIAADGEHVACGAYVETGPDGEWQEFDIDMESCRVCVNCMAATNEQFSHDYNKNRERPFFIARQKLTRKDRELARLQRWNDGLGI